MEQFFRVSMVLLSAFLLSACGGDTSGNDDNSTNEPVIKKTGQTKSYNKDGNKVTDGSIKDDGYYKKGVAPTYTRDDNKEIVTDSITNLQWQDDVAAEFVAKSWTRAKTYCTELTLGGYSDWRLPSIDELMYIADRSRRYPAIDPTFQNVSSANYWSSTSVVGYENDAWYASFSYGGDYWYTMTEVNHIRCVRGEERSIVDRYTRSDEGIVSDHKTGLQWQDDYSDNNGNVKSAKWVDAISYCENLSLAGYTDWRLPNFNELYSLTDHSRSDPAIDPLFLNTQLDTYWSSTSVVGDEEQAWGVYFSLGGDNLHHKSGSISSYVRCVRTGE